MRYLRVVKIRETENRMGVVRSWGKVEVGSYCLMGKEFQFYKMKELQRRMS